MEPLPRHLLPLSFSAQVLKNLPVAADARVLPGVDDLAGLAEAIKACALSVAVIGPDWPRRDVAAAQEMAAGGLAQFQGDGGGHRRAVGQPTNAIGAEITAGLLAAHGWIL